MWTELCLELEDNIWGDAYKIATRKFGLVPYQLPLSVQRGIGEELFPTGPIHGRTGMALRDTVPQFTGKELRVGMEKLKNGTAAGHDGILLKPSR